MDSPKLTAHSHFCTFLSYPHPSFCNETRVSNRKQKVWQHGFKFVLQHI